jgi:dihydroneopterin aldolase
MDSLQITALSIMTHIGIHDWEQRILQELLLDIQIPIDITTCHDQIKNTIDYDQLCQRITTFIESNSFSLIETVAEKVGQLLKTEFNVEALTLTVSKPHAIKSRGPRFQLALSFS